MGPRDGGVLGLSLFGSGEQFQAAVWLGKLIHFASLLRVGIEDKPAHAEYREPRGSDDRFYARIPMRGHFELNLPQSIR